MIFGEFPLAECEGLLLAHSLRLADGIFKKGRRLASADFPALDAAGITRVYGARLEPGDLDENAAAAAVAATTKHRSQQSADIDAGMIAFECRMQGVCALRRGCIACQSAHQQGQGLLDGVAGLRRINAQLPGNGFNMTLIHLRKNC